MKAHADIASHAPSQKFDARNELYYPNQDFGTFRSFGSDLVDIFFCLSSV